jgi:hypothetical protein
MPRNTVNRLTHVPEILDVAGRCARWLAAVVNLAVLGSALPRGLGFDLIQRIEFGGHAWNIGFNGLTGYRHES